MDISRRKALVAIASSLSLASLSNISAAASALLKVPSSNSFEFIYNNPEFKKEFFEFLVNVFHLYPENEMHNAIEQHTQKHSSDENIYKSLQESLSSIKPILADLTYALPALAKQKEVIGNQTTKLLGEEKKLFNGYLEIGSNGRYLDALEERLNFEGDVYFLSEVASTYSPVDMIDRGQICKSGVDIALNNYKSDLNSHIKTGSIDLATVYIGFHHCPLHLREEFITSIRDSLSSNGILILRDHNAYNKKMWHMVALAHDVFNMGTQETWEYNKAELRHFYSLVELDEILNKYGFKSNGQQLYQQGDPTKNALMRYQKA